jgi:RHS repeat-associated protein
MRRETTIQRLPYFAVLALLLFGSPAASASGVETPPPSTRIVPTDGPVTSTTGTFVYDPSGNVAAIGTNSYVYDPMSRVTTGSVDRSGNVQSQTYTYDLYGNRLGDGAVSYSVSTVTNRLTGSGAQYDAAGNLTQWQPPGSTAVRSYSYDALNTVMREKVTVSGTDRYVVHIYTADDERYWNYRDNGAGTVEMTYALRDLDGSVLREYAETATSSSVAWTARDYVYRDSALLASYDTATGDTHHYSLDHLGTPRMVTDQDHVKVAEHTYFPFGAEYTDGSPTDGRLHFTGHEERDADFLGETRGELDYMHARYYSPNLGRFMEPDAIDDSNQRFPQSFNRYTYVRNRPLVFVDPTGTQITIWAPRPPSCGICDANYAQDLYDVYMFLSGAGNAIGSNFMMGRGRVNQKDSNYQDGQLIGDGVSVLLSGYEMFLGVEGGIGGTLLDFTGGGAAVGIPVQAVSGAMIVHGSVTTAISSAHLMAGLKSRSGSGKERSSDIPSWAKGQRPRPGESGRAFAKRLMDEKYGPGNYPTGPGSEFSKLKKYGDRAFQR